MGLGQIQRSRNPKRCQARRRSSAFFASNSDCVSTPVRGVLRELRDKPRVPAAEAIRQARASIGTELTGSLACGDRVQSGTKLDATPRLRAEPSASIGTPDPSGPLLGHGNGAERDYRSAQVVFSSGVMQRTCSDIL